MIAVEIFDYRNANWKAAFDAAIALNDSFRNDFLRSEFWPAKYDLSGLPPTMGHDRMLEHPAFSIATHESARQIYLKMLSNPRYRLLIYRDSDSGDLIGMASLILPDYVNVSPQPLLHRLKTRILSAVFKVRQWWAFKQFSNPLQPAGLLAMFQTERSKCEANETPERVGHLRGLDRDALAKTSYPSRWSYYLNLFALIVSRHGTGSGSKMMDLLIEKVKLGELGPLIEPPVGGPAKLEMFSSPRAANFYKRCGFSVAATYEDVQPSGRTLPHNFFFMNLT